MCINMRTTQGKRDKNTKKSNDPFVIICQTEKGFPSITSLSLQVFCYFFVNAHLRSVSRLLSIANTLLFLHCIFFLDSFIFRTFFMLFVCYICINNNIKRVHNKRASSSKSFRSIIHIALVCCSVAVIAAAAYEIE